jgi:F-type H+-transporting ATPase subunit a
MGNDDAPQNVLERPLAAPADAATTAGSPAAPGVESTTSESATAHAAHGAGAAHEAHDPLAAQELMHHVQDAEYFHVPRVFSPQTDGRLYLPQWRASSEPILQIRTDFPPVDRSIAPLDLRLTKFMVLEVVGALLLLGLFIPLARRLRGGGPPRGRWTNLLEAMVLFIRNQVARPTIGAHDGDRFAPFLLTMFFFVLTCNLLGLVPWAGSPTAALGTTGALAVTTFLTVIVAGSVKLGPVGFWLAQVPHMEVHWSMAILVMPLIFGIEVLGLLIKHFVLAMRLLANMMAGNMVLAVLIAFISASASSLAFWGVMPASIFGSVALSLLELLVAFLQAYIFTFLSGLFIGMAVHPH